MSQSPDHFRLGITYYKQGEYKLAFDHMVIAAEKDDPKAQYNVGHFYEYGFGVDFSFDLASRYYTLAATQGHEGAIEALQRIIRNRDSKVYCFCRGIDIESTIIHSHQD